MNTQTNRPMIAAEDVNPISMMFDPVIAERVSAIAETLAKGRMTVPEHLRGNIGDCLAIVMQAASWRLNPFAVAQKTHLIHGKLGYEAQLVNSVVSSVGLLQGRFRYEYLGDWKKIAVRPKIIKGGKGEYPTPGWPQEAEHGLGLRITGRLKGEADPLEHDLWLETVWPRNSGLWATNPQQQIAYLGVKQWVRKYAPEAILGIYTTDEIEERVIDAEIVKEDKPTETAESIMDAAREIGQKEIDFEDTATEARQKEIDPEADQPEVIEEKAVVIEEQKHTDSIQRPSSEDEPQLPKRGDDGRWRDSRGLIFDDRVHGMSVKGVPAISRAGHFTKRRGCDPRLHRDVENLQLDALRKKDDDPAIQAHHSVQSTDEKAEETSELFSFSDIRKAIDQASTLEDCDQVEDMLRSIDRSKADPVYLESALEDRRKEVMASKRYGGPWKTQENGDSETEIEPF